jgi:hypothetical protein
MRTPNPIKRLTNLLALLGCLAAWSSPAPAQTNFVTLISDGAWTWYNDPRAMFLNGKLYFGYVRAADSKTALSVFDPQTGLTSNLWSATFTERDDHNNPGLLVKQDGKLLAIYARHGSDQYFAFRLANSTNPVAAADWNAQQQIPNTGASMTYANPFQLSAEGGKIYNFCRNLNYNPTIFTSTDGGTNWSVPQHFIKTGTGGSIRPYVKYASNGTNRIDFLYTDGHPRDVNNSLYHLYYQGGAFYKTDGTFVTNLIDLPLQHDAGQRGSVIYQYNAAAQTDPNEWIPTGRAWCWETAYQSNGAPVSVFTVQRDQVMGSLWSDDRIYYYYARWTGSAWQKRFIAHAGRPLYSSEDDYAGGICLDPQNPNVIYISSNAQDPFNLADTTNVPLRANNRYELWQGVTSDGGLTFTWTQITTNSTQDNLRPYVPRRNGGQESVIWFQGTYSTYINYSCSVVGLFASVNTPPQPAKITYVDATAGVSGNTALAAGGVLNPTDQGISPNGNDGLWRTRLFGNGATTFESGGDNSTTGSAAGGNNEDVARVVTTVDGLYPGRRYAMYAYFWSATAQSWRLRASLTNSPGDLPLFSHPTDANAVATSFSSAVLVTESDRVLKQVALGETTADANGRIRVYVDDDPAARTELASAWNWRTWYDGVGYVPLTNTNPPSLNFNQLNPTLEFSWPAEHVGWRLETNSVGLQATNSWFEVPASTQTNLVAIPVNAASPQVYFRLVY